MKDIRILYEDDDILAINKPAGIAVHGDGLPRRQAGRSKKKNLVDWLLKKYPKIKNVGEPIVREDEDDIERHGIVHRLDKDTSGVLLAAKTEAGFEHLKAQFKNREIKKTYHAFVYGKFKDERGVINKQIGREAGGVRRWATGARARGEMRDALTRYKVLKTLEGTSFLEIWPQTGRTHQIRVHMNSVGHPVVADPLYAPRRDALLGFTRQALHASKIVFKDLKGKTVEVKAPFPEDFERAMQSIK